ncbi:MAG: hypothetical protein N3E45_01110 [Oscillatoriaceae bacterium SKW80]|nr:hypothetical protein [Oscillatoriaceae bacterium SKW80]
MVCFQNMCVEAWGFLSGRGGFDDAIAIASNTWIIVYSSIDKSIKL